MASDRRRAERKRLEDLIRRAPVAAVLLATAVSAVAVMGLMAPSASAATMAQINAYFTNRPVEPTWFTPTPSYWCANFSDMRYVDQVSWSSWGGKTATGTAIAGAEGCEPSNKDGVTAPIASSPVSVVLSGRRQCGGFSVYTRYSLQLAPGAVEPSGWSRLQYGRFPCNVAAAGCTADAIPGRFEAHGPAACALGLDRLAGRRKTAVPWRPKQPPGSVRLRRLLAAKWRGWRRATTVGRGAMLDQHKGAHGQLVDLLWPAEVELSKPIWCPRLGEQQLQGDFGNALVYTRLKLTLYGQGLPETNDRARNARMMVRARHLVGRPGLHKQVFRQHSTGADAAACGF